jgi:hypothetical protein
MSESCQETYSLAKEMALADWPDGGFGCSGGGDLPPLSHQQAAIELMSLGFLRSSLSYR